MHRLAFVFATLLAAVPMAMAQPATQVFPVPPGSGPHDVAPGPDGLVWYSAQRQGALGILDPRTGAVRQVPLGPDSAPHGVIQGPDGAAWLTDGGQNAIVRVDPKTDAVTVWKLPESTGYANLNTAVFDAAGMHWFTGQNGVYGRLDPKTGAMQVWKAPGGRGAYGIAATPDGGVYYVSLAGSHLARIDPATGAATVIEPPTKDQGARRVWPDSKGNLWVSEWNSGNLSRYTPSTGEWKAWRPPGAKPRTYRSTSTTATSSGQRTSPPTPPCRSTRRRRPGPASPARRPTPTSARSWAAPAKSGCRNPAPTGSCWCGPARPLEAGAPHPPARPRGRAGG